jgi:RNA-directed DNA polymerase
MTGSDSIIGIDLSLKNIWQSWFNFRKGKKYSFELHGFQYNLEKNLFKLFADLNSGKYKHGGYSNFIVCDNKRREISVACIRDRVVHRLIYDYLNKIYDKTFIYDAWSCRVGKGLLGAIERTQGFLKGNFTSFIWKADIKKFFDSVDHGVLLNILKLRIKDIKTFEILKDIIFSFTAKSGGRAGMPIGNLTSQIFANIYLNELDHFVIHQIKPKAYLRYADDFILIESDLKKLKSFNFEIKEFLKKKLRLSVNFKSDKIIKVRQGLKFLGVKLWYSGRILNKRNFFRIQKRLNLNNISSYSGLIKKHGNEKERNVFDWMVCEKEFLARFF